MKRKINIIEDIDGKKTVFIHDIIFKGKRSINWDDVERYLQQYVGEFYNIEDCNKVVYIGKDLPDEYTHSKYTRILKGTNAKAKANVVQGLPELLQIASNEIYEENRKEKHIKMQNMVGILMMPGLHYQYLEMMGKLKDTMFLM